MTPKEKADSRDASQKGEDDWLRLQAATPTKKKGHGGFGMAADAAGLSHRGAISPLKVFLSGPSPS